MSTDFKFQTTNDKRQTTKYGFTLIEILIVLLLLTVLLGVSGWLFVVSLRAWDAGCLRTGIREDINCAMEKLVRDLKGMAKGSLHQYSAIAHTIQYNDLDGNTFVIYLYNPDDASLDSSYTESIYDLRKANITSGDSPSSGEGILILRDLVSPDFPEPATDLSINGNTVILDLVVQREDEIVTVRTKVRPRNL